MAIRDRTRRHLLVAAVGLGLALLAAAPAVAQPDFLAAFKRMDRNGDNKLNKEEFALRGPDAARYETPVGRYETADGFGIEVWESPLGVRASAMTLKSALWLNPDYDFSRTSPDRSTMAWRLQADSDQDGNLSPAEFETRLRSYAGPLFSFTDRNRDGALTDDEIAMLAYADERPDRSFEGGPGGDAMRAKRGEILTGMFLSFDIDGDHKVTLDEALERWLARFVGAYAP